jgi:hypothetical protein
MATEFSPKYSTEILGGAALEYAADGSIIGPYTGTAYLWIKPPGAAAQRVNVQCVAGVWSYANYNNKTGPWAATLLIRAAINSASPEHTWVVADSFITEGAEV